MPRYVHDPLSARDFNVGNTENFEVRGLVILRNSMAGIVLVFETRAAHATVRFRCATDYTSANHAVGTYC